MALMTCQEMAAAAMGCAANMDEVACNSDAMNDCEWDMAAMTCND